MSPRSLALLGLSLALLAADAGAVSSSAGTASAQFLKLGVGARANAMGGTCAATCDDAYSLYWNPAGLSRISARGQVALYQSRMYGLLSHDFVAAAARVSALDSVLAVGLTRLGTNQKGYDAADNPTGDFSTQDLAVSLGIARRFEPFSGRRFEDERSLRAGAAVKMIRQSVPGAQTSSVVLDLGLQSAANETADNSVRLGLAALNLGGSTLPRAINLGASYLRAPARLTLAGEIGKPADGDLDFRLGLEWRPVAYAAFRAGYGLAKPSGSPLDSLSLGGSFKVKSLEVGCAFISHADLGSAIQFDAKLNW